MKDAVIVDAIRTPIARYAGSLKDIRSDDLAAFVIKEIIKRNNLESRAEVIEDVLMGCANQAGEDNRNVARMALLLAGLPVSVAGGTVNRLCGSGLMAVNQAACAIQTGAGDVYLAGGVESMTRSPFVMAKPEAAFPRTEMKLFDTTLGWRFTNEKLAQAYYPFSMGETAENVAEKYKISRESQDQFALNSQHKYQAAKDKMKEEIVAVPIPGKKPKAPPEVFSLDEHPRADSKIEDLTKLKPAFRDGGTVTAGNSSGINDGAACLLLTSSEAAKNLGLKARARIVSSAVAGCDPSIMGIGPVEATRKALKRASLSLNDIDLFELNEAFAAQVLACVQDLEVPLDRLNVNGGSIALGHPLGASGARILTTLLYEMERRKSRYGLATMCIGVGQGIATIIERLD